MLCNNCRAENPAPTSHCGTCGSPLIVAVLEELTAGRAVHSHYVFATGATIGRHQDNSITLDDPQLSRFHSRIDYTNGKFFIEDLNSRNGILVNDVKIRQREIRDLDRITLGRVLLRFRTGDLSKYSAEPILQTQDVFLAALRNMSQKAETAVLSDEMLEIAAKLALNLTHAERAVIFLYDNNRELQPAVFHDAMHSELHRNAFEVSHSTIAEAETTGEMVMREDCLNDPRYEHHQSIQDLQLNTIICLPLKSVRPVETSTLHDGEAADAPVKGVLFGVLYLDSRRALKVLPQHRRTMLEVLAELVSLTIENAMLQKEMRAEKGFKKQIRAATDVLERLFPQPVFSHPRVDMACHFAPAHSIGGDYLAFLPLSDSRFLFAIGDVAGKGLPAGLIAMTVHGGLYAETTHHADLLTSIHHLDQLLHEYARGKVFVTFFAGVLDLDRMQLEYTSAGHNPPLLYSAADDQWRELVAAGIPLGVDPDAEREVVTIELQAGDLITLYTDGVTEARGLDDKQFGKEGLKKVLNNWLLAPRGAKPSLLELVSAVAARVQHFTDYQPPQDDKTLMAMAIK